jgi:hypothetical protein
MSDHVHVAICVGGSVEGSFHADASRRGRWLGSDASQSRAHAYERSVGVVWLGNRRHREVADHFWSEYETVGGTSKLEVTEFLAFDDMASGLDALVDDTRADL